MQKMIFKSILILLVGMAWSLANEHGYTPGIQSRQLLKTTTTVADQPVRYLKTDSAEVTALEVEIPPGMETGWHKHPVPAYGYILSGKLTLEVEGGKTLQFEAGRAFVESMNLMHNGKNTGTEPLKILVFYSGEQGKPITVRKKE